MPVPHGRDTIAPSKRNSDARCHNESSRACERDIREDVRSVGGEIEMTANSQ
jgi:hypothetical protein